jgi:hypothetical protein
MWYLAPAVAGIGMAFFGAALAIPSKFKVRGRRKIYVPQPLPRAACGVLISVIGITIMVLGIPS